MTRGVPSRPTLSPVDGDPDRVCFVFVSQRPRPDPMRRHPTARCIRFAPRVVALCRLHGITELWTADRDFARFPGLTVRNPLVE